ncbi:MAG: N(4)-(beta-N-acetylglucosaminyl)-L-asparaginase [Rhodothermales bacterium]|nr:N(4)-(beta-N-acetylglucosaminyl)-L-asparaginase [Rhodothermales bacterium]
MPNPSQSRRDFLKTSALAGAAASLLPAGASLAAPRRAAGPVVIASGNGLGAVERALGLINSGADALDAVVAGVNLVEEDPDDMSVGYGGLPNEDGVVQLDSAVMHGPSHRAGAVAALEGVKNPSKVAKLVLERTDHVLLVADGAQRFARMHGIPIENLLTDRAREVWVRWKENLSNEDDYLPKHGMDDEDIGGLPAGLPFTYGTIHCSAIDLAGNLSSVTTTSGLSFKIPGRVGDSPIIGAGLYCDNAVGAAGSTGRGEANLENCACFLIVERMRMGDGPEDACLYACQRIAENTRLARLLDDAGRPDFNVSFYAVNKAGEVGGARIRGAGRMAVADAAGARLIDIPGLYS